jgi:hypothetical protein
MMATSNRRESYAWFPTTKNPNDQQLNSQELYVRDHLLGRGLNPYFTYYNNRAKKYFPELCFEAYVVVTLNPKGQEPVIPLPWINILSELDSLILLDSPLSCNIPLCLQCYQQT